MAGIALAPLSLKHQAAAQHTQHQQQYIQQPGSPTTLETAGAPGLLLRRSTLTDPLHHHLYSEVTDSLISSLGSKLAAVVARKQEGDLAECRIGVAATAEVLGGEGLDGRLLCHGICCPHVYMLFTSCVMVPASCHCRWCCTQTASEAVSARARTLSTWCWQNQALTQSKSLIMYSSGVTAPDGHQAASAACGMPANCSPRHWASFLNIILLNDTPNYVQSVTPGRIQLLTPMLQFISTTLARACVSATCRCSDFTIDAPELVTLQNDH